jgi:drug/metabolite transporter (DMT)-like permease
MAISVRFAGNVSLSEKILFRNIFALAFSFYLVKRTGSRLLGKPENRKFLLGRAVFGNTALTLYFWAIMKIPVADATMLNNLSPFFVTIFAWFFLKEKLSKLQFPSLVLVFIASLLIIKPKFDFSAIPAAAGAFSAVLSGMAYVIVRYLHDKENPATIVFFFSLVSAILVLPAAIYQFQIPTCQKLLALSGIGIFASVGQITITYAYKFAKATEISLLVYVNVLFTVLFGWLIWNEIPDIWSLTGGITIIGVSAVLFWYNKKYSK